MKRKKTSFEHLQRRKLKQFSKELIQIKKMLVKMCDNMEGLETRHISLNNHILEIINEMIHD